MRWISSTLGVFIVASFGISCGPPPVPLTGSLQYTQGGRVVPSGTDPHPSGVGAVEDFHGVANSGGPPLILNCSIATNGDGSKQLHFPIGRTAGGGAIDTGKGITVCGHVTGSNQDVLESVVNLYFDSGSE